MADIGTTEGIALTKRIMHHVVGIYFEIQFKGQPLRQFVHTAFLFSVGGRWMLMTAGHCVTDIREMREHGGALVRSKLIDSMGEGASYRDPVPFAYDESHPMHIGVTEDIDYGVLFPPQNTCQVRSVASAASVPPLFACRAAPMV